MAKGTFTPEISVALQETVRKNPRIKNVYFAENGTHYFKKHTIEVHSVNEEGFSKGAKKVESLPGARQGVVKVTLPNKSVKDKMVNVEYNAVAAEMTRQEILDADVEEENVPVDGKEHASVKAELESVKKELEKVKKEKTAPKE